MTLVSPGVPPHYTQLNDATAPARCRSKNCVACAGVMAAYRVSGGRFQFTATQIRNAAGASCDTGTGGIGYLALVTALDKLTGGAVKGTVRFVKNPDDMLAYLRAGCFVIMSGSYAPMVGKKCAAEDGFAGGHAFPLNALRDLPDDTPDVLNGDPLRDGRRDYPKGWGWCKESLLVACGLDRMNGLGITFVAFRDTEGTWREAREKAPVRAAPRSDGKWLASTVVGEDYWVKRTVNGRWAYGRKTGVIWHEIVYAPGKTGFVRGPALV